MPVAGKVCDGVCAVDVVPSPKFQAYDVIVPSGSPEPTLVNEHASALQLDCTLACGGRFAATAPAGTYTARPCCLQVTPVLRLTTLNGTVAVPFQSTWCITPSLVE